MEDVASAKRVELRFFALPEELRRYISSIYLLEVALPPGEVVSDWLMPEWASVRMAREPACLAALGVEPLQPQPLMLVAGPTSHAVRVETGTVQIWGIGILPLGWARLVRVPASAYANRLVDGQAEPKLEALAPLHAFVSASTLDFSDTAEQLAAHLLKLLHASAPVEGEARIVAAHRLLIDEDVATVAELAARLNLTPRTLERFCSRVFGFPPKLLLRRQRFTRSLAQFLLDPSLAWIKTLDAGYVDQAHFVRDFKHFMGMSPSAYAAADKPILRVTAHARNAAVGGAVQALHQP